MSGRKSLLVLPPNANITSPQLNGFCLCNIAKIIERLNLIQNSGIAMSRVNNTINFAQPANTLIIQNKRVVNFQQNTNAAMDPTNKILNLPRHTEIKPAVNTFMNLPVAQTLGIFLGAVVVLVFIISFIVWIQCRRELRKERAGNTWDEENRLRILPSRRDPLNCRENIDDTQVVVFPGRAYPKIKGGVVRSVPLDKKAWVRQSLATIEEEEEEV